MRIRVEPSRLAKGLGGAIFILALFFLLGQFSKHFLGHGRLLGFVHQFDLGGEGNIATYVATFLLLLAAVLLGIIACHVWGRKDRFRWYWGGLALIFLYLSIDEFAQIHESVSQVLEEALEVGGLFFYP